jgi:hypothetical protein
MPSRFFVRGAEVPGYHPANHTGTRNHRLIGEENVGARGVEVVLGVIERGKGALPHAHPGIEQVRMLEALIAGGRQRVNLPATRTSGYDARIHGDERHAGEGAAVYAAVR